ncbi:Lrp/AsnC family transcriptional regulator [Maricaulis sp.]|uniref:Lrp/AsnC family transcriptional regulator n=1 Tax=unclassified Maricaulis TaxID=2632371 RepID=UPI001B0BC764|nr:Lrp/AsnC family transcriptional regulator [Maricaulis sp.]MBO6797354.1 Lrp/AsnC family transcriptional regulator [Maricaulis sp.]
MIAALDNIDVRILEALQEDAGQSVAEVAEKVGLTPSPCWRRIRRLETEGIIKRRSIQLDRRAIGLMFTAYIEVKIAPARRANYEKFEEAIQSFEEVTEAVTMTGPYDYLVKVVMPDIDSYNDFVSDKLIPLDVIGDFRTSVQIRNVKDGRGLPLSHIEG